jgi:hypothetical protein
MFFLYIIVTVQAIASEHGDIHNSYVEVKSKNASNYVSFLKFL